MRKFAILLATWNGERFLKEQLQSLSRQTVSNVDIWLSDDGSTDQTLDIAKDFQKNWTKGQFELLLRSSSKPKKFDGTSGATENFRSLILNSNIDADYFAFCDQDDIWDDDKLERARNWLNAQSTETPCLYCSRTRIVDSDGKQTGFSPNFKRRPGFGNAIVQNIASGNTIVMNRAAMDLVRKHSDVEMVVHDWWCYIVVSAFGGAIHYNPIPDVSYRQHGVNLIGENSSWQARMNRLRWVRSGRFKVWNEINRRGLSHFERKIGVEEQKILSSFDNIRKKTVLSAIFHLANSGIYRQTIAGEFGLYYACLISKL